MTKALPIRRPQFVPVDPSIIGNTIEGSMLSLSRGVGVGSFVGSQWQQSDDGSTGWTDIDGQAGGTLSIPEATLLAKYIRCSVTWASSGEKFSNVLGPVVDDALPSTIVPGSGWSEATAEPDPIGESGDLGYGAKPAARWSRVCRDWISGNINVGLEAYHVNGIQHVLLAANGGDFVTVSSETLNSETGRYEYWATLDVSAEDDGLIEVRAIVVPKTAGQPRVMQGAWRATTTTTPSLDGVHSFEVWNNRSGTYDRTPIYVSGTGNDTTGNGTSGNPYRTLAKAAQIAETGGTLDGCIIRCKAGEYVFDLVQSSGFTWAPSDNRWVVIEADTGVARGDVTITYGRPQQRNIKLRNVTIEAPLYTGFVGQGNVLWFDGCEILMPGGRYDPANTSNYTFGTASAYATDSDWTDVSHGPSNCLLVRNCTATTVGEDFLFQCRAVLGFTGEDLDQGETAFHPDCWQIYAPGQTCENMLVSGCVFDDSKGQTLHVSQNEATKFKDSAFVNISAWGDSGPQTTHFWVPQEHVIFRHVTLTQQLLFRHTLDANCSYVGCVVPSVGVSNSATSGNVSAADWRHNHFVSGTTYGTDATTGAWSTIVGDQATGDLVPIVSSPLLGRVTRLVPIDAAGVSRPDPSAVGAYERP